MKQNNVMAHLRRLCCSGLSKEIVIAEFLRVMPLLIPSSNNTFTGTDGRLYPQYHIAGFDIASMRDVIPEIVASQHTRERQERAIEWFKTHPAITDARVVDPAFYSSDLYHLVYRRFDMHHVLWMPVEQAGEKVGVLGLYRPRSQSPFDHQDQALLSQTLRYVGHALVAQADQNIEYSVSGYSGMMLLNGRGEILCKSQEADRLLNLACYPLLTTDRTGEERLMARLGQLCGNLAAVYRGEAVTPPSFCHTNPCGRFLFRAYRIGEDADSRQQRVGVTIEQREPITLIVLRAIRALQLSPMQQQVAQLVAQGLPFKTIGSQLHIKPTTVKDHVDKIYLKLDICQRDQLLPKLMAMAC